MDTGSNIMQRQFPLMVSFSDKIPLMRRAFNPHASRLHNDSKALRKYLMKQGFLLDK